MTLEYKAQGFSVVSPQKAGEHVSGRQEVATFQPSGCVSFLCLSFMLLCVFILHLYLFIILLSSLVMSHLNRHAATKWHLVFEIMCSFCFGKSPVCKGLVLI